MATIRSMHEADVDAVRQVEATAFGTWWQQQRGPLAGLTTRTRQNILSRLDHDPAGCFVAEEGGPPVGFIFSCTWGRVGWFGTFAVLPEQQGRGLGKQLIAASLDYLRQEPGRVIGLETMPESPYNLGLYLGLGFQPRLLNLLLTRSLDQSPLGQAALPRWSQADGATQQRWLAGLQEATAQIYPGLDYSKEIVLTARHGLGETLVLQERGQATGMSVVALETSREGWGQERANVQVMALHPAHTNAQTFRTLLAASEDLARAHGKQTLTVSVYAGHAWALEQLLRLGYRVERGLLRMVLSGADAGPSADRFVELSRWAG
jgi:ribosomal protein S18 acetylase RimI-like enzyme